MTPNFEQAVHENTPVSMTNVVSCIDVLLIFFSLHSGDARSRINYNHDQCVVSSHLPTDTPQLLPLLYHCSITASISWHDPRGENIRNSCNDLENHAA